MQPDNRSEYLNVLNELTKEVDRRLGFEAGDPIWRALQSHLREAYDIVASGSQLTSLQLGNLAQARQALAVRLSRMPTNSREDIDECSGIDYVIQRLAFLERGGWAKTPWPTRAAVFAAVPAIPKGVWMWLLLLLIVMAIAAGFLFASGAGSWFMVKFPHGSPLGPSVRAANQIATLINTQEEYRASLHPNPADSRVRISLFLQPVDGKSSARKVELARRLNPGNLGPGTRILGYDGHNLWFNVDGIGAWDLQRQRLIRAVDLKTANPSLKNLAGVDNSKDPLIAATPIRVDPAVTDLWGDSRRFDLADRLRVTTPDYQHVYEVDPATLQASLLQEPGGRGRGQPTFLLGLLASLADVQDAQGRVQGAQLRETPNGAPSDLMIYASERGLKGTLMVTRMTGGASRWTADTGIYRAGLQQVLTAPDYVAFVGPRPQVPDKVSEPLLVIVNRETGAVSTTSLWQ